MNKKPKMSIGELSIFYKLCDTGRLCSGAETRSEGKAGEAGPVSLDGTKVKANASKHKAMS